MKYRKKLEEVEAMHFTNENKDRVLTWASDIQNNVHPSFDADKGPIIVIPTIAGETVCTLGDYLIKEPFPTIGRKLYTCSSSMFNASYTASEEVNLKPCPFCGAGATFGTVRTISLGNHNYRHLLSIGCAQCDYKFAMFNEEYKIDASGNLIVIASKRNECIDKWNKRSE